MTFILYAAGVDLKKIIIFLTAVFIYINYSIMYVSLEEDTIYLYIKIKTF